MISRNRFFQGVILVVLISFISSGCSVTIQKGRRSDIEKIESLMSEIKMLNTKLDSLEETKSEEVSELEKAKRLLEQRLKKEIGDRDVRLEMAARGLTIVFLTEILFDSGKAELKEEAFPALDKVAKVLKENLPGRRIGVEGHTDNEPIKYSGWKSNWELSVARAAGVLHYLVDQRSLDPTRMSITGYGEYRPVTSNDTPEGRKENRRVEIVILPKNIEKIQADIDKISERKREIQKRLKKYKK